MRVVAPTDRDALLIFTVLLNKNRHMVVDRRWNADGTPSKEVIILVDAADDEAPTLAAAFALEDACFSIEDA